MVVWYIVLNKEIIEMKAVVYSVKYGSDIILELWVERLNICVNEKNEIRRAASPSGAINHFGTFDFPDTYLNMCNEYLERKEEFESKNVAHFNIIKLKLVKDKNKHYSVKSDKKI
jgi:hypothetical protein